jgi:NodT family efflux transporter outer membrane factor (OMF) lipoprotein
VSRVIFIKAGRAGLGAGVFLMVMMACTVVGPDFVKPEIEPPAQWNEALDAGLQSDAKALANWWQSFNDPVLNNLVQEARENNNNLEIAALRVLESRAQLGIATGKQYPQSQVAFGDAAYISPPENSGISSNYWQYALGASISWEADFWGRFQRGVESADAAFLASISAYDQSLILLTAQVVDTYTRVRGAEEQLRIAHENVVIQQRSFDIASVLFRNGADSELDVQQSRTLLLSTQATIPGLEISISRSRNALSALLGRSPGAVKALLGNATGIPVIPTDISIGIPADMLRLRPDVRQAELQAMAQNALVGLAQADLYPSFSLTGFIGLSSGGPGNSDFGDLFNSDALSFSVGPSIVWPFLNYGRIKNNVRVQDARLQQALVFYRETVLQAAREAEDSIADFTGTRKQTAILAQTVESAIRSNELSTLRYREGFSDYQRVLDSQQALFSQQQRYITNQENTVHSLVAIYKALGGGWQDRQGLPPIKAETLETMQDRTDWGAVIETDYPGEN